MKPKPTKPMQASCPMGGKSFICTGPDRAMLPYHQHETVELTYCEHGHGTVVIGNHLGIYNAGDLFVIGKNIPHAFVATTPGHSAISGIEFFENFLGNDFLTGRDFKSLEVFLYRTARAIKYANVSAELRRLILQIQGSNPADALLALIMLLHALGKQSSMVYLNSNEFTCHRETDTPTYDQKNSNGKLEKIIEYTRLHYADNISLSQMASLINFTETSFCRYFKEHMGKSYFQYLNEIRIDNARRLLIEWPSKNMDEICFECGFNNASTFYKQFKRLVRLTPKNYQLRGKSALAVTAMVA